MVWQGVARWGQECKDAKMRSSAKYRERERGRKQKKVKAVGSKMQTVFRTLKWNN